MRAKKMACTGACSSRQGSGGEQRQEKHYELKKRSSVFGMPAPRIWPPPYSPHLSAMGSPEDSWEARAFAEDMATCSEQWPPRSYSCSFCGREFRTAQALGGHMNVHRRERAYANQIGLLKSNSNSSDTSPPQSGISPASQPAPSLGLCLLYPNAQNTPPDSAFTHRYNPNPNPNPNPRLSSPQCSRSKNSSDSSLSEPGFLPESLYPVDSSKHAYRHPAWDALDLHDDTLDLELRLGHAP